MCVAAVFSGRGFRIAASDLGFNIYDGEERVDSRLSLDRLMWARSGWVVGSGEARTLAWSLQGIRDASDTDGARETVREAAERAERFTHDPDQLWSCTTVLTADHEGVSNLKPAGEAERHRLGGVFLLLPGDVEDQRGWFGRLHDELDPADRDASLSAIEATVSGVAAASEVTADAYSVGLLERDGGRWKRTRLNRGC